MRSLELSIGFLDGRYLPVAIETADIDDQIEYNGDNPTKVDPARNLREHLQLHARRLLPPNKFNQPEHRGRAVVQQARQKNEHSVEREADLPARHHLVDAVVQQSHHVEDRHQRSPQAGYHGPVVDEVEEGQVVITAAVPRQDRFGAVCDY